MRLFNFSRRDRTSTCTINGVSYTGKSVHIDGRGNVFVDGVQQDGDSLVGPIAVTIHGSVDEVETTAGNITINGTAQSVKSISGDVRCGDVSGSVQTMSGDVSCGSIGGAVSTMSGDINGRARP